ncbi:hypothetical protein MJA45_04125 [Paenibacillus aurantius]|uniref:Uncharacterized protein n=1 Tax=Paenibacillus aurantius TaxID=2918900 RepID=A0AA96LEH9_9BACL|nr:hypothetical protein [Paenibacillus aurantius]WNQ12246.1 hypothetical protein MJA45_04125 [Paenibacillus aurantius]
MESIKPGDIVKHKKDKYLIHGVVKKIAKSGVRALVDWDPKDNPKLLWRISIFL